MEGTDELSLKSTWRFGPLKVSVGVSTGTGSPKSTVSSIGLIISSIILKGALTPIEAGKGSYNLNKTV